MADPMMGTSRIRERGSAVQHRPDKYLTASRRVLLVILFLGLSLVIIGGLGFSLIGVLRESIGLLDEGQLAAGLELAVSRFQWTVVILAAAAVGLALYAARLIRIHYERPLQEAGRVIERMSQGDLSQRLPSNWPNGIGDLAAEFNAMAKRLQTFTQLSNKMASGASFEEIFDYIYDSFHQFLPYDRMGVSLIDPERKTIRAERARSRGSVKLYNGYTLPLEKTSLPKVIESGKPRIISDLEQYLEEHPQSESTRLVVEEGMRSSITLPLKVEDRMLGALFFSSRQPNAYDWKHVVFLELAAGSIAPALEKGLLIGDLVLTAIIGFSKLATYRDVETGEHLRRMRRYASALAKEMSTRPPYDEKIDEDFIRDIYYFSPLHDIGKIGIPDRILLKPGKLTPEEFEIMKNHTLIGAQALREAEAEASRLHYSLFKRAIDIAAYHHERYDGTGYPLGLKGDEIPLCARIVALADVFDALTSPRPYKPAYSFNEAVKMIVAAKGTHFEPGIVDSFLSALDEFRVIYDAFREAPETQEAVQLG
jgi:HD-GYP domain-containing protein (c-di-GMP phosphodiesterase class II)/HAMP domain-containing protein